MRKDVTIRDAAGGLRTVPVELHVGGDEPDLRASLGRAQPDATAKENVGRPFAPFAALFANTKDEKTSGKQGH